MNKLGTKCFRAWRWISVAMWLRPSTRSSSFSPTSSSPFSGALMENVFSKASGSDSLIEIKRLFKIFPSMLVFLLQGQDVGCQVGNVCFGSPIILWDLCKCFFSEWKESLGLSVFHNLQRSHAAPAAVSRCLGGKKPFSSIFHFRPRWNWKLQKINHFLTNNCQFPELVGTPCLLQ